MAFPYREIVLSLKQSSGADKYLTVDSQYMRLKLIENSGVFNPLSKFTIEDHSSVPGLVHIRGPNNKYLMRTGLYSVLRLTATKREENEARSFCTSFRAIRMGQPGNYTVKFVHVELGRDVGRFPPGTYLHDCLGLGLSSNKMVTTEFNLIDYTILVNLPKRVAFKNIYDKLIAHRYTNKNNHNRFLEEDIGEDTVDYDIYQKPNGDIQVRSRKAERLWSSRYNWVLSDTPGNSSDPHTMFRVHKRTQNRISLYSRGNSKYCARWTDYYVQSGFAALANTPVEESYLEVIEPLIERRILVEQFRLRDARIYNDDVIASYSAKHTNKSDSPIIHNFIFSETVTDISSWSTSQTLASGYKFSFTAGVPKIGLGYQASIQAEHSDEYEWGKEVKSEQKIEATHTMTVPKKTIRTVKIIIKAASCDVPFSYTQTDRYTNGDWEPCYIQDGVFRGTNAYGFYYESFDEPYSSTFDEDDPIMSAHLVATESGVVDTTKITLSALDDYGTDDTIVDPTVPPALIPEESDSAKAALVQPPASTLEDPVSAMDYIPSHN